MTIFYKPRYVEEIYFWWYLWTPLNAADLGWKIVSGWHITTYTAGKMSFSQSGFLLNWTNTTYIGNMVVISDYQIMLCLFFSLTDCCSFIFTCEKLINNHCEHYMNAIKKIRTFLKTLKLLFYVENKKNKATKIACRKACSPNHSCI